MILCFELSMPNNNSWNGKWSGEDNLHAKVVNLGKTKRAEAKGKEIIENGGYYYNFGDGWGANVSAREVNAKEGNKIRRKTKGFCGYDWMIDSIRFHGDIRC